MTSMRTMLACAVLSVLATAASVASEIQLGHLIFPNMGLNAIQELDPATNTIVQTIPLPAPYNYRGSMMLSSALIRSQDRGILLNVRDGAGQSCALALSSTGQFVAATPSDGSFLQQIRFDPTDRTESTVLGGTPFLPEVRAVNPYGHTSVTRVNRWGAGNFIGLHTTATGRILAGDYWTGEVMQYSAYGSSLGVFANVGAPTGSNEINGLAMDAAGCLYAAQNNSQHLAKFSPAGNFLGVITASSFRYPAQVFYNRANDLLYVGNNGNGRLTVMHTDGTVAGVVNMGGWGIGTGALVVPEPATLGLLSLGLLLLAGRRR